jgi:short-subunit dehydrogenase
VISSTIYKLSSIYPKKRAFITGAGSGLGRALCIELARDGWNIGISDVNEQGLKETEKLILHNGGKAILYLLDVADHEKYSIVVKEYLTTSQGVDLLINNAGVGAAGVIGNYPPEEWKWVIGINQLGVIHGCHYFVPTMKKQKLGQIINIASAAGFLNPAGMAPYNSVKAAVISISETLYAELRDSNVKVSVVMPTYFNTNIIKNSKGSAAQKAIGQQLIDKAGIEPAVIAQKILKGAGNKKLHIILPFSAKISYLMKRLFPDLFVNYMAKMYEKLKSSRK